MVFPLLHGSSSFFTAKRPHDKPIAAPLMTPDKRATLPLELFDHVVLQLGEDQEARKAAQQLRLTSQGFRSAVDRHSSAFADQVVSRFARQYLESPFAVLPAPLRRWGRATRNLHLEAHTPTLLKLDRLDAILRACPSIKGLDLQGRLLSRAPGTLLDLSPCVNLKSLRAPQQTHLGADSQVVVHLGSKNLRFLVVNRRPHDDTVLRAVLAQSSALQYVFYASTDIGAGAQFVRNLGQQPQLTKLSLTLTALSAADLTAMQPQFKQLTNLSLKYARMNTNSVRALFSAAMPKLLHLDFSHTQFKDADFASIAWHRVPNLRSLVTQECDLTAIASRSIDFDQLLYLKTLVLSDNHLGHGPQPFLRLNSAHQLEKLDVANNDLTSKSLYDFDEWAAFFPRLSELTLLKGNVGIELFGRALIGRASQQLGRDTLHLR